MPAANYASILELLRRPGRPTFAEAYCVVYFDDPFDLGARIDAECNERGWWLPRDAVRIDIAQTVARSITGSAAVAVHSSLAQTPSRIATIADELIRVRFTELLQRACDRAGIEELSAGLQWKRHLYSVAAAFGVHDEHAPAVLALVHRLAAPRRRLVCEGLRSLRIGRGIVPGGLRFERILRSIVRAVEARA